MRGISASSPFRPGSEVIAPSIHPIHPPAVRRRSVCAIGAPRVIFSRTVPNLDTQSRDPHTKWPGTHNGLGGGRPKGSIIMRPRTAHRRIRSAALFTTAMLVASSPLRAQNVKVNIPGAAFNSVGGRVAVDDVGGGRRFRGEAFALVTLQAKLQMPSTSVAEPRLQRLVIRFRTSASGPSLRAVELRNGSNNDPLRDQHRRRFRDA